MREWVKKNRANLIFVVVPFTLSAWLLVQQGLGVDVTPW